MSGPLGAAAAAVVGLLLATSAPAQTVTTTSSTTSTTLPRCSFVGAVDVWAINESGQPSVTVEVDGDLDADAVTCGGGPSFAEHYEATFLCAGQGLVRCTTPGGAEARIVGLRPGAWTHRIRVAVPAATGQPANDVQRQARRAIVVAPSDATLSANPVIWTIHGFTRAVTSASAATLQAALDAAATWTAANAGRRALITLRPPGPVVLSQRSCAPEPACNLDSPKAGLCLNGDRIVIDGRDEERGQRGAELNVGTLKHPVVRVYGRDAELRGLVLRGTHSADPVQDPQADTVDFMSTSRRSAVVDSTVLGPSHGDAVGAQCGAGGSDADANLVVDSTVRAAQDKGVKVATGAVQLVSGSCIADNENGGIQATDGGRAIARENVVQHNVPDEAENGIFANENDVDAAFGRSSVTTRGNIVRFSGNRGLSVVADATGDFRDDYVARNQYAGARVESTQPGVRPEATFRGVAFVCNKVERLSGSCSSPAGRPCLDDGDCAAGARCTSTFPEGQGLSIGFAGGCSCVTAPCACPAPAVTLGDGGSGGAEIALTENQRDQSQGGRNLVFGVPGATFAAGGTQWEDCSDASCDPTHAEAIRIAHVLAADGATVTVSPLVRSDARPRTLLEVSPARPRAGDVVRVYGTGFDAVLGNALSTACQQPPARGADFCDPSEPELAQINRGADGNRLRLLIRSAVSSVPAVPLDLVAVTPTMLAFRMPTDCFGPHKLTLNFEGGQIETQLCDPSGCAGQAVGFPCPDDGFKCTADVCDGAGACVHPLQPAGTVCNAATDLCDAPEACDGVVGTCPADARWPAGHVCRPGVDLCDEPETCSGTSKACPADRLWDGAHVCREVAGDCDVPERCTLGTATCPADAHRPAGFVCRAVAGACDVAEQCDGGGPACPADVVVAGIVCRTSKGECDPAEACDGVAPACPADAKSTALCRPAAGPCDLAEQCNGVASTCPADAKANGTSCRAAAGPCDLAEACDGTSDACPADGKAGAGITCRPSSGACDPAEVCDGTGAACPADALMTAGTACRPAQDPCDVIEACDGASAACPTDLHAGGLDAIGCRLGQLEGVASQGCEPRRRKMVAALGRAAVALQRTREACIAGRVAAARRAMRRLGTSLTRLDGLLAADPCLDDRGSRGRELVAASGVTLRAARTALPETCGKGGG